MKLVAIAIGTLVLTPALAVGHPGGLDRHGCHEDKKAGNYHCHAGELKDRTYKSRDTMLKAHPELMDTGANAGAMPKSTAEKAKAEARKSGDQAKREKAEDKVKDGDKKTTDQHVKESGGSASPAKK